jgi:hypothetical protein
MTTPKGLNLFDCDTVVTIGGPAIPRQARPVDAGANPAKVEDFGDKDLLQLINLARILFGEVTTSPGCALRVAGMKEVLRTNDLVLLSYATHVLAEAGIEAVVFDAHMSAVEGSIGAFPRRLMVNEDDFTKALRELSNLAITGQQ